MKLLVWFLRRTLPFWWIAVVLIIPMMKVAGTIDWSWWAVTGPAWLPFLLVFGLVALAITVFVFICFFKSVPKKW